MEERAEKLEATPTEHLYVERVKGILSEEPVIKGTRISVRTVVEVWRMGTRPEEIPVHYPHLSLAAVFDALSYYCDHRDEIEMHIERNRIPEELVHPLVRDL